VGGLSSQQRVDNSAGNYFFRAHAPPGYESRVRSANE
jgi:hypothetical protein